MHRAESGRLVAYPCPVFSFHPCVSVSWRGSLSVGLRLLSRRSSVCLGERFGGAPLVVHLASILRALVFAAVFLLVVVVVDGEVHGSFDGCLHMIIMARTFQLLWSRRDGVMRVSSPKPCPIFDFSGGYRLPQASSARGSVRLVQREYL